MRSKPPATYTMTTSCASPVNRRVDPSPTGPSALAPVALGLAGGAIGLLVAWRRQRASVAPDGATTSRSTGVSRATPLATAWGPNTDAVDLTYLPGT